MFSTWSLIVQEIIIAKVIGLLDDVTRSKRTTRGQLSKIQSYNCQENKLHAYTAKLPVSDGVCDFYVIRENVYMFKMHPQTFCINIVPNYSRNHQGKS